MKNFLRSLRYLRPYRTRLIVSVVCVLLIAALWGGGLGALLPGLKLLMAPEGLHGWAWNALNQDRFGARLVRQETPAAQRVDGQRVLLVIGVAEVTPGGPADRAGIRQAEWIVGIDEPGARVIAWQVLSRRMAVAEASRELPLRVYNQRTGVARTVRLTPGRAGLLSRCLGRIALATREPKTYPERFPLLIGLVLAVAAVTYLRDILRFIQEYLVASAVLRAMMDLRADNYNVALRLPMTFFSEKGSSDTMSRFIQDTNELARGQVTLFGKTLVEPAKAIGAIAVALLLSWKLTLVVMLAGPPAFILVRRFGRRMRKATKRALEGWSSMLGVLAETLTGIRVVKAYTMEGAERKRFFRVNRALLRQQNKMAKIDSATAPAIEAMGITGALLAVALAGYWVLQARMDPYAFMTWMACLAAAFDPVRKLAKVVIRFQRSDAAAARIFELQDQPQERHVADAPMLPRHAESLEFRNVVFRYPSAATPALRGVNLRVAAGETLAVVGPNGSGKTTLVSLLPRLLDPDDGAVLIDGCDIAQYSVRSVRRQIGLVTQEAVLFHATIAENIAYGLRRPKRPQILDAARKAFVDEFVRDLPDGYETIVGEHGATLSGGQRQRITIARAILRDPAILIFDEAMSQVDAESEQRIHDAMAEFVRGRTTLLIAHRFATVLQANRIVVMDAGRIVDIGAHAELLDRCGLYRQLYRTQLAAGQDG